MKTSTFAFLLLLVLPCTVQAQAGEDSGPCGSLNEGSIIPLDYRKASAGAKWTVESHHFTPMVERLERGITASVGADIAYTLRMLPNHPRALLSMQRLTQKTKRNPAPDAVYTIECYYERALRHQPDDHLVRMLYVARLIETGKLDEATRHLDYVVSEAADDPITQYNAGLLFFDMKNYDRALQQAHRAMEMGNPRQDLRKRLESVGRWVEPAPQAAASAASAGQ